MAYEFAHFFDFNGGENQVTSPDNLLKNECLIFRNAIPSLRGGCSKRTGITEYKSLSDIRIDRIIEYEYLNEGVPIKKLLVLSNGELIDTDTSIVLKTGLGRNLSHIIYKNKLYILSNGMYLVYDGGVVSDVTCSETESLIDTIKKCRYIAVRGNRVFMSGNPDDPNALYFSELGQPEYFKSTAGNPIMAMSADGDIITGLAEFHGAMLVFKSRHIYAWFGYDPLSDAEFQKLNVHTGTKSFRTIQNVGNYLYFLGEEGIYALHGTYKDVINTAEVSINLRPMFKKIKHKKDYAENTPCAIYHDGMYMLSVGTVDAENNDTVIVAFHDRVTDESERIPMGVFTGWNISDFLKSLDGNLYSASSVTGRIHKHEEVYRDLDQPIEFKVRISPKSMELPIHLKKFRNGFLALRQFDYTEASPINLNIQVDYITKSTTLTPEESLVWDIRDWDISNWDWTDMVSKKFRIRERGKRLIIEIQDNVIDHNIEIYGVGVEYKVKKPDKNV